MIYVREFELYEDEGYILAVPLGMKGGTFGEDVVDAVQSASDWLHETLLDELAHGSKPAQVSVGGAAAHGGRIVAVSVDCDLSRADAVTAADAARMLGISTARVAQMCENGQLTSWKEGSRRMVMRGSVKARIKEAPKAGRPKTSSRPTSRAQAKHELVTA